MKALIKKHSGVIVPMVTPFDRHFMIDIEAVNNMLELIMQADVSPFFLGTTGESVSVSESQKAILVKSAVNFLRKRKNVYVGISGNCLQDSVESAKLYADMGADAFVAHLPFYYPMEPGQMIKYFEQLAESIPCPLILYNMPMTTRLSIPLDIAEKLSYHPNIVAMKDSERGLERLDRSIELWKNRKDFSHLTGWAAQSCYALKNGSDGIIPSTGNFVPQVYKQMYDAMANGEFEKAEKLHKKADLISEVYQKDRTLNQSLPALKIMMMVLGLCQPYVMPPLYRLEPKDEKMIIEKTNSLLDIIKEYKIAE